MSQRLLVLLLLSVTMTAGIVAAGTIQMVVASTVTTLPASIDVRIPMQNLGSEAARMIVPQVEALGVRASGARVEVLDQDGEHVSMVTLEVSGLSGKRGVWPVFVRVRYEDANGHPFEAVHVGTARVGAAERGDGSVHLTAREIEIEETGQAAVTVDAGGFRGSLRLTLVAPTGLAVRPVLQVVEVDGPDAVDVPVVVTTAGATAGSTLPLIAVAEYDVAGGHRTVVASTTVTVNGDAASWSGRWLSLMFVTLLATWTALAGTALWRRRRHGA